MYSLCEFCLSTDFSSFFSPFDHFGGQHILVSSVSSDFVIFIFFFYYYFCYSLSSLASLLGVLCRKRDTAFYFGPFVMNAEQGSPWRERCLCSAVSITEMLLHTCSPPWTSSLWPLVPNALLCRNLLFIKISANTPNFLQALFGCLWH